MIQKYNFVYLSAEGAGARDGAFRSLVAVLHLRPNRLPHGVHLPRPQGPAVPLGPRPRPGLRLPGPSRGSDLPPDRSRGRGAGLGPRGEPAGGGPLHSGPPVAGTLEPQTEGLPGAGQEGTLPGEVLQQPAPSQGANKAAEWVHPPSPADGQWGHTLCEGGGTSNLHGATHTLSHRGYTFANPDSGVLYSRPWLKNWNHIRKIFFILHLHKNYKESFRLFFYTEFPERFRKNRRDFASYTVHTCYVAFKCSSKNVKKHKFPDVQQLLGCVFLWRLKVNSSAAKYSKVPPTKNGAMWNKLYEF